MCFSAGHTHDEDDTAPGPAPTPSGPTLTSLESAKGDRFFQNIVPSLNFRGGAGDSGRAPQPSLSRANCSRGDKFWSNIVPSFIKREKKSSAIEEAA